MSTFKTTRLNPLKKVKGPEPFAVCDIEGWGWLNFVCIGVYDGSEFEIFDHLADFFEYAGRARRDVYFAHFGGIYDFLFLIRFIILSDGKYTLDSLIPRGSGILCMDVVFNSTGRRISFRDSGALLPSGLARLTDAFQVPHKKKKFDFSKPFGRSSELDEYLKYDCVGLYEVLTKYYDSDLIRKSGAKTTVASQSLQIFRSYLKEPLPACPESIDTFVRRGYAGGRTEIFRPFYKNTSKTLKEYDINSLYPFVMATIDVPGKFEELSLECDLSRMGFVDCLVSVPKECFPILWHRDTSGKFVFPTGEFRGVFTTAELSAAVARNARIRRVFGAAYFAPAGGVFREFVKDLYRIRTETSDPVLKEIIKLTLNSLYGRCGMHLIREGLVWDEGQPGVKPHMEIDLGNGRVMRFATQETRLRSWNHVGIAAWITAHARLRVLPYLEECGDELYYTDTDSIWTTKTLPTGTGLGELKEVPNRCPNPKANPEHKHDANCYGVFDACFLLPKTYVAGGKVKMKGFPDASKLVDDGHDARKIKFFQLKDFEQALEGDLRAMRQYVPAKLARFKTALRHGDFLYMQRKGVKQIKSRYDKRVIFRDGAKWESRPIHLSGH